MNSETVHRVAREILERQTRITGAIFREGERRKAVIFFGPTGGGKTTTLAKVAARYALTEKKKVVLVTLDTYRIAAVEQLKIYARILGTPVEVALSPPELRGIFRRHPDADLFLMDTAGRNQKDPSFVSELHSYFPGETSGSEGGGIAMEGHLVLPATLRPDVLQDVVRRFSELPVTGLLFTKLDEVDGYGSVFNTMIRAQIPLSYFTTGQRVPEDIEQVTPEKLAQWVMG
jgi:flagellar biosynthesis protein FlhF